jgi:dTMP kinase
MSNFIVFEGLDGAGKTTLIENLTQKLNEKSYKVYIENFPRKNNKYGLLARKNLKHENSQLFSILDMAHFKVPRSFDKTIFIAHRFNLSALVYSSVSENFNYVKINKELLWHFDIPDILFYLNISPVEALKRIKQRESESPNEFKSDYDSLKNLEKAHFYYDVYIDYLYEIGYPSQIVCLSALDSKKDLVNKVMKEIEIHESRSFN